MLAEDSFKITTSHDMESVWELREEQLYPSLFGQLSRGILVRDTDDIAQFGRHDCDPRWLHLGVFEYGSTAGRASWVYVTSGGSTPWDSEPSEAVRPRCVPVTHSLPSGKFDLIELVGVSSIELEFARAHGTSALIERLSASGIHNVTDVHRASVLAP